MKTNIFKVKEKKEKRIIIEEETLKNPLLLFFKRNRKTILRSLFWILICLILVSIGFAFSLFRGSNDYDITYITGSEEIGTNNNPEIDDEEIEEELLGEVSREDGVVVLVRTYMTTGGDVVSYFTDGTSIIVTSKGKVYRVSRDKKGKYGVDKDGNITKNAQKFLVTATISTLEDGTVITYYSDGTAKVDLEQETIFVRDSNNIKLIENKNFDKVNPSGVALSKDIKKYKRGRVTKFTDGTTLVSNGDKLFIVNKNTNVDVNNDFVNYDKENVFSIFSEKTYKDGNVITHFTNGSAVITDKKGNIIYVKKSGDIVLKDKELYEIVPNNKSDSMSTFRISDGVRVIYYDNGAAVIVYKNNDRKYVEDSDDIIYKNNRIVSEFETSKLISIMMTDDGKKAYSFENGKSQVINSDNTSYIVDTDTLNLKPIEDGKPEEEKPEEEDSDDGTSSAPVDPGAGIHVTKAEHKYDDPYSIQSTTFVIKNNNNRSRVLRIVLEEISDYTKYITDNGLEYMTQNGRLEPRFVKFQATVGDNYVPATVLNKNTWVDSDGVNNYILYDGIIGAKETLNVAIALYVDYNLLGNSDQNKGFIGTIKVYVDV